MRPGKLLFVVVLVVGTVWAAASYYEHRKSRHSVILPADTADPRAPALLPSGGPQPHAEIETPVHNFGEMLCQEKGSYSFVLRNTGEAPLQLVLGDTSCKCTLAGLQDAAVPPGGSTEIKLDWTAREEPGQFTQNATILTNDPEHRSLRFEIQGMLIPRLRKEPDRLTFTRIVRSQGTDAVVRLTATQDKDWEITEIAWSNADLAEYFDVQIQPADPAQLTGRAQSGYQLRITIKPGMPVGSFEQKLILTTTLPKVETTEIAIQGEIAGSLSIVGRGVIPETNVVVVGTVHQSQGAVHKLRLLIRGENREQALVTIQDVYPEYLEVTLGEPTPINEGTVLQYPLEVRVPPGAPPGRFSVPDSPTEGEQGPRPGVFTIHVEPAELGDLKVRLEYAVQP